MTAGTGGELDPLVAFMLDQPGLLDTLNGLHTDDGAGYCRACPGPQSGRRRFPCDIRLAIDRALIMRARRDGQGTPRSEL